jgi:hypothetical protein
VLAKDIMTQLVSENGDLVSMEKRKIKRPVAWFGNFFIICIILSKWSLAHFVELRGLNISTHDVY